MTDDSPRRGILGPADGPFSVARHDAKGPLAAYVESFWSVRWDAPKPHVQETLPYPSVHFVVGDARPGLHGVVTKRFAVRLARRGNVFGVKFRPGAFRPFLGRDVSELTDRVIPVADAFEGEGGALDAELGRTDDDAARIAIVGAFLLERAPEPDAETSLAVAVVDHARTDRSMLSVDDLAARAGVSPRSLQRLFRRHVGVGPKWVIRRFRMHEAAERVASGGAIDWASLVADLGYFDQAHFIRDFKAQIGRTPTEYAAFCASAGTRARSLRGRRGAA